MSHIFCVANQKGGVGKTTTTVNLAAGLAAVGQRVLMVDLDPQGNATMSSGVDKRKLLLSVYDVLLETATITEARIPSRWGSEPAQQKMPTYDVLGASRELAGAEVELVGLDRREFRLKQALAAVDAEYDFVLIDCPPSLSMLTLNGLCCAHGVIVPMQCEYFALEGLTDLVNTIKQVHANLNKDLAIIGLLVWLTRRKRTVRPLTPEQRALAAIEELRREGSDAESYAFGVKVSDALRAYIRDQHGLDAVTRTSVEFLEALRNNPAFTNNEKGALSEFLESVDLLKYARLPAGADDIKTLLDLAERLVRGEQAPVGAK